SAIAQAPPLFRSRSRDESRGSQLDGRPRTEEGVDGGMPPLRPSSPLPPESNARSTQVGANQEERSLPIERAGERTPLQARVLEGIQQTGQVVPVRPDWDPRGESKMADFTADGQPLAAEHNIAPDTAAAGIGAPIASAVVGSRLLDVGEAAVTASAGSKAADSCANRQGNELGISSSESNIPPSSERGVKTTGVAQPRAAPGFGREEVSLDELETGQVGTGKGTGIADVDTDGFSA
ncbi:unnamed protein product, partial [Ectocarpus sp. 8 AP-2014]